MPYGHILKASIMKSKEDSKLKNTLHDLTYSHGGPASPIPERLRNRSTYCAISILVASRNNTWYCGDNSMIGIGEIL